jgi:hypothetical protein
LYPVGPRTRTMMHLCASAAKLRGGGPILFPGMKAKGGNRDPATSNRHRDALAKRGGPRLSEEFCAGPLMKLDARRYPLGSRPLAQAATGR